jgi:transcriptional regulator with XRE-family HTH domain
MTKAKFSASYDRLRELLVAARKSANLTQEQMAKRLGQHQSFLSKVEQGERLLDVVEFIELAQALKADPVKIVADVLKTKKR